MKNTWIKRVWFQALVLALGLLVLGTNDAIAQTVEKVSRTVQIWGIGQRQTKRLSIPSPLTIEDN